MTVQFFKTKSAALASARHDTKLAKTIKGWKNPRFIVERVQVTRPRKLYDAGFKLMDKPMRRPKKGEFGYVTCGKLGSMHVNVWWIRRSGMKRVR